MGNVSDRKLKVKRFFLCQDKTEACLHFLGLSHQNATHNQATDFENLNFGAIPKINLPASYIHQRCQESKNRHSDVIRCMPYPRVSAVHESMSLLWRPGPRLKKMLFACRCAYVQNYVESLAWRLHMCSTALHKMHINGAEAGVLSREADACRWWSLLRWTDEKTSLLLSEFHQTRSSCSEASESKNPHE